MSTRELERCVHTEGEFWLLSASRA
jgi:hypothetical protein